MVWRLRVTPNCLNKLSWRYRGRPYWNLLVMIWTSKLGVAKLLGSSAGLGGAIITLTSVPWRSQQRQLYLGRICSITFTWAGTNANFSLVSSPMQCNCSPQHWQVLSSSAISNHACSRGRSAGNGRRLVCKPPLK